MVPILVFYLGSKWFYFFFLDPYFPFNLCIYLFSLFRSIESFMSRIEICVILLLSFVVLLYNSRSSFLIYSVLKYRLILMKVYIPGESDKFLRIPWMVSCSKSVGFTDLSVVEFLTTICHSYINWHLDCNLLPMFHSLMTSTYLRDWYINVCCYLFYTLITLLLYFLFYSNE